MSSVWLPEALIAHHEANSLSFQYGERLTDWFIKELFMWWQRLRSPIVCYLQAEAQNAGGVSQSESKGLGTRMLMVKILV